MTLSVENNLQALYGATAEHFLSDVKSATSPLYTVTLPLKTNDPVRRKLHPWFEDFEFYKFNDLYIIYYTGDKDEIYVAKADLFTLQMLLINVNLENHKMRKKARV